MDPTARSDSPLPENEYSPSLREGFLHFAARESATWVGWVCIGSGVATIITFAVFFPFAVIPGSLTFVSAFGYWFARIIEKRTETLLDSPAALAQPAESAPDKPRYQPVAVRRQPSDEYRDPRTAYLLQREGVIGFSILFCVGLLALTLSLIYFEWSMVLLAAFILFCYMLLIMAPVWLGWIEDDIEDTETRLASEENAEPIQRREGDPSSSKEQPALN